MLRWISLIMTLTIGLSPEHAASASNSDLELICSDGVAMGTPFKICVYAKGSEKMGVQFDLTKAFRRLAEINSWMSDWQPGTELNQINAAAGARPTHVRKELYQLLRYTRQISEASEGAFDPTFNAFWGLYRFKENDHREPTQEEIQERLPLVNYRNVEFNDDKQTVFLKKPGMKLGLGGIGQGYGVDAVVQDLKKRYAAGYVDGSGDTYFWGRKPGGELWLAAIRDPRDKTKIVLRVYGTDFAVTTAGDDEKYFMVGDRRVHHIIDPKTGKSATASRQVTVIASNATEADAFDTAAFVLGPDKGMKILEERGMQAVFVSDAGVAVSAGLKSRRTPWGEVRVVDRLADRLLDRSSDRASVTEPPSNPRR